MKNKFLRIGGLMFILVGVLSYGIAEYNSKTPASAPVPEDPVKPQPATDTVGKPNPTTSNNESYPLTELLIPDKVVDFGTVRQDTVLVAEYKVVNTGNSPVIIYYVNPDCSCTDYSVSDYIVKVNETAMVTLTFDTKGRVGTQRIYSTLCANTEDKMYKLTLKANVEER